MCTVDLTLASLRSRQSVVRKLWEDVDGHIRDLYDPRLPVHVMQKTTHEQLKLLVEEGSLSVDEWRERTGGDVPNGDPFHPLIRLENERIVLDREALLGIGPDDMYAWHYAVLRAAVEGNQA